MGTPTRYIIPPDLFRHLTEEVALIGELMVLAIKRAGLNSPASVPLAELSLHYGHAYDLLQAIYHQGEGDAEAGTRDH
jgi:hypothetical protein